MSDSGCRADASSISRGLALLYATSLAAATLYPWEFSWPYRYEDNGARWAREGGGIEFQSVGLVRTSHPPRELTEAFANGEGLTLETWITSATLDLEGPARILSYSDGLDRRNFTLGQDADALVVRLRTAWTNPNWTPPEHRVRSLRPGDRQHVVITYDRLREIAYLDGREVSTNEERIGSLSNWDSSFPLLLGNETTGTRPWLGRIHLVALYNRPLGADEVVRNYEAGVPTTGPPPNRVARGLVGLYSFTASEGRHVFDQAGRTSSSLDLEIPDRFRVGERELFGQPRSSFLYDRLINVLIFVPFGFLVDRAIASRRRQIITAIVAILAGTALTASMEAAQYFLASRHSSISDVIHNSVGTLLGVGSRRLRARWWIGAQV